MLKVPSPIEIELWWKRLELGFSKKMSQQGIFAICIGAILLLLLVYVFRSNLRFVTYSGGGINIVKSMRFALDVVIVGSLLRLLLPSFLSKSLELIVFISAIAFSFYKLPTRFEHDFLFLVYALSTPFLCLLGFLALKFIHKSDPYWKLKLFAYILISFLFIVFLNGTLYEYGRYSQMRFLSRLNLSFITFSVVALILRGVPIGPWDFSTSLIHVVRGIPWPISAKVIRNDIVLQKTLWWNGAFNITLGFFQIYSRMAINYFVVSQPFFLNSANWASTLFRYVLIMLANIGYLNILTGVLRISGVQVPDATNFKWLSRTPTEFWQRGNVYLYKYIRDFIYFPALRFFKDQKAAFLCSFTMLFFFKTGLLGVGCESLKLMGFEVSERLFIQNLFYMNLVRWILWVIMMRITRDFWFFDFRKVNSKRIAWFSIILSHMVLLLTYFLAYQFRAFIN